MTDDTEREALIRILVEVERGTMTDVEWKVASLTPANGIRANAILTEFLPDHDERVREQTLRDFLSYRMLPSDVRMYVSEYLAAGREASGE